MGNRFSSMVGYKAIITAHGVLMAITFLFVIPGAIFMARFYHRNPRTALRFHIWLQVLAVLLSTAAIVLAFQAVGRERSLTNPHHGIGVALYTLVMVQALGGSVIHRLEKGKERFKIPLKLYVRTRNVQIQYPLTHV
jgi:heme/copper-type cytochrome/quinol oxidase subunit 1